MLKEITFIPKGKDLLEVLNEMGDEIKDSWIFVHENVRENLRERYSNHRFVGKGDEEIFTIIQIQDFFKITTHTSTWGKYTRHLFDIMSFQGTDEYDSDDPEKIYFFKMEES